MESTKEIDGISIKLNNDEALVLSDWLSRFNNVDNSKFIQHQSENRILYDIESILEKNTNEIFNNNYLESLVKARDKLVL